MKPVEAGMYGNLHNTIKKTETGVTHETPYHRVMMTNDFIFLEAGIPKNKASDFVSY